MSDEPKSNDKPDGSWVMPEPIYRSTPGHTPKSSNMVDPAAEIPTEPGFSDDETIEDIDTEIPNADDIPTEPGFSDDDTIEDIDTGIPDADDVPTERPVKAKPAEPNPKKKRGCARSFLTVVSLIALAVIGVVIAVVYFLFYYKSADSTF